MIQLGIKGLKIFTYGLINKFKAWFYACCDHKLEGAYFFEIYDPVVKCKTMKPILILEVLLGIKYKQGDMAEAFLHADVDTG